MGWIEQKVDWKKRRQTSEKVDWSKGKLAHCFNCQAITFHRIWNDGHNRECKKCGLASGVDIW